MMFTLVLLAGQSVGAIPRYLYTWSISTWTVPVPSLASAMLSHHVPDGGVGVSLESLQSPEAAPFATFERTAFFISTSVPDDGTPVELYVCFCVSQSRVG